jgi:acyl-CoA synthetase (AMP-forming)/AMP-acid ligase II
MNSSAPTIATALERTRHTSTHRTALVCGDVPITYAQLAARCDRVGAALASLGLNAGDRVAILAANCHRYVEAYMGVPAAGMVLLPLNTRLATPELAAITAAARPKVLITDRDPGALADALPRVVTFDEWDVLLDNAEPIAPARVDEDDLALLYFTGGTTGRPKGVMLSHRNLVANSFHKTLACRFEPDDVYLAVAPFFHVAGTAALVGLLWMGGSFVVLPAFDAADSLDQIERHRATVAIPVPTMVAALVAEQAARPRNVSSLRLLGHAGSPITTDLLRRAHDTFPNAELAQFYGATETASIVTCMPHEERHLEGGRLGSVGQPAVGVEVAVIDGDGRRCAPGVAGEVIVRGPNVMVGYWEDEAATVAAFVDGWYRSGDIGFLDDEHYLSLLDRAKDMIVTGGENVYSLEVEDALGSHPAVLEVAVFGVPDERWVEAVHAVVVVRDPSLLTDDLENELRGHCRSAIAGFKVPKAITIQVDPLPKSGPGKILKRQLRAPYWEGG